MHIADFNVKITQEDGKYTLTLKDRDDAFEVEVDTLGALVDEVDELIQARLVYYGITVFDS